MKNLLLLFVIFIIAGCHSDSAQPGQPAEPLIPINHQLKYEWHFDGAQTKNVIYTGANGSNVYLYPTNNGAEGLTGSTTITVTKVGRYNLVVDGLRAATDGVAVYVRATIYLDGSKSAEQIAGDHVHAIASIGIDVNQLISN